jgi:hypothetical protein
LVVVPTLHRTIFCGELLVAPGALPDTKCLQKWIGQHDAILRDLHRHSVRSFVRKHDIAFAVAALILKINSGCV